MNNHLQPYEKPPGVCKIKKSHRGLIELLWCIYKSSSSMFVFIGISRILTVLSLRYKLSSNSCICTCWEWNSFLPKAPIDKSNKLTICYTSQKPVEKYSTITLTSKCLDIELWTKNFKQWNFEHFKENYQQFHCTQLVHQILSKVLRYWMIIRRASLKQSLFNICAIFVHPFTSFW